jgi:uncharacterized RDD family membrane protein YckC
MELPVAEKSTRFVNHLIDGALMFALFISYVFASESMFGVIQKGDYLRPLGGLFLYLLFYAGSEYFFSKTPGKFITKTRVVTAEGLKPSLIDLIGRTICRLIPFNEFSFLGDSRGWHDSWSGTYVIKDL